MPKLYFTTLITRASTDFTEHVNGDHFWYDAWHFLPPWAQVMTIMGGIALGITLSVLIWHTASLYLTWLKNKQPMDQPTNIRSWARRILRLPANKLTPIHVNESQVELRPIASELRCGAAPSSPSSLMPGVPTPPSTHVAVVAKPGATVVAASSEPLQVLEPMPVEDKEENIAVAGPSKQTPSVETIAVELKTKEASITQPSTPANVRAKTKAKSAEKPKPKVMTTTPPRAPQSAASTAGPSPTKTDSKSKGKGPAEPRKWR